MSVQKKKKVLVMDDEDMVRDIACQMVEYVGFSAIGTANGTDAVKEYAAQKNGGEGFAAVIMDLSIPGGMGGKEAIVEILAIDKDVKAFVSSGYLTDPIMINYQDYGFSGVLPKPFDLVTIQQVLSPLL